MYYEKRIWVYVLELLLGAGLIVAAKLSAIGSIWIGMGGGLIAVGALRLVQCLRIRKDRAYREQVETEAQDERNAFLRARAWSWAGYAFLMICAAATIVLMALGKEPYFSLTGGAMCLLVVLYWVSYLILQRKY